MTLLLGDPRFLDHDTGPHVETADRLRSIHARLKQTGIAKRCTPLPVAPLTASDIAKVHDQHMIELVRQLAAKGGGRADADTVVSPRSFDVALFAAGGCCAAVDAVLAGKG